MDKSSVSYAAVFNLQKEAHLVGIEYSWLSSVVYCAQLVCQPISGYALIVFPVKYWVMFNMTMCESFLGSTLFLGRNTQIDGHGLGTVVTMVTASATNFVGLLLCRLFLGCFEATILPSFILVTQMWWIRREQSYRTIAYQVCRSVFIHNSADDRLDRQFVCRHHRSAPGIRYRTGHLKNA